MFPKMVESLRFDRIFLLHHQNVVTHGNRLTSASMITHNIFLWRNKKISVVSD